MTDLEILDKLSRNVSINFKESRIIDTKKTSYTVNKEQRVTSISISDYDIYNLGYIIETLQKFSNLKTFVLNNCYLNDISSLKQLTDIEQLIITKCNLKDLYILQNLTQLTVLFLNNNGIANINPLKNLTNLEVLSISNNFISNIAILKEFKFLSSLRLENNRVTDISALEDLKELENVDLSNNKISEIPSWIIDRKYKAVYNNKAFNFEKSYINFYDNPLKSPSAEIVKEGQESLRRYYEKKALEGSDYIYESKVTLVGEGSAGKTSLQLRLNNPEAELPQEDKRTRGIEIVDWIFMQEGSNKHIAHIWDFGGQDVYYPVHRFFLTENSVFILLASTRQKHHDFNYWIPTIYQFGGKSPIILGQTCHDGNKVTWNDIGNYTSSSDFNIIKTTSLHYHELNLPKNNEGLQSIRDTIIQQITSLPQYGKEVPKSWAKVRNELASLHNTHSYIFFDKFIDICTTCSPDSFNKYVDIEDCGKFLHSIGIVLWYADNPYLRDIVVLQPEWAMNAVYKIIDDDDIQNRRGNIISADFNRLWTDECYVNKHNILKKMLEVFKIAFPKKHKNEDYLIPARLVTMPSREKWHEDQPLLRLEYQYDFMPRGLVNQLSAELSRYIEDDNKVWNNAVNFSTQNNTAGCQVEEDFHNRKISVKAKGQDARDLIILVMNALNDITDGYRGVKPKISVPCTCELCRKSGTPELFKHDQLIRKYSMNERATVTCNESDEILRVEALLYNVGLSLPKANELSEPNINKKKQVFVSYSKYDVDYLQEFIDHCVTLKEGCISTFNCREIILGENWDETIKKEIDECDIMVCLVSVKFLNTDYIRRVEIKSAIEKGKRVIPVIIKACDWEGSELGKFQAAKRGDVVSLDNNLALLGKIKGNTSEERAAFWTEIIKEFREKICS